MKPLTENLNISILEFFSILLPGAVSLAMLYQIPNVLEGVLELLPVADSDWQSGLAFFLGAYFLGYVFYVIGSRLDDWIYEPLKKKNWIKDKTRIYKEYIKAAKLKHLGFDDFKILNNYQWSWSCLMHQAPELFRDAERPQATSKFFRTMVIVLFLGAIIDLFLQKYAQSSVLVALIILSLWIYIERRQKAIVIAYQHILNLKPPMDIRELV